MLGGLVSWVTTGLLGSMGSPVPRGTVHQARDTTDRCDTAPAEAAGQILRLWCPDSSMGTGLVNGRTGAVRGVWGRGCRCACGGVADTPCCGTRGGGARRGVPRTRSPWPEVDVRTRTPPGASGTPP